MVCLSRLPDLLQRGRVALKPPLQDRNPATIAEIRCEMYAIYQIYGPSLSAIRHRWRSIDSNTLNNPTLSQSQKRICHCNFSRIFGFALTVSIAINSALVALDDLSEKETPFEIENARMADEILDLAPVVGLYRPLAASVMTLCLGAAWVGARDPETRKQIEDTAIDFQKDFYGVGGPGASQGSFEWCAKQFSLQC